MHWGHQDYHWRPSYIYWRSQHFHSRPLWAWSLILGLQLKVSLFNEYVGVSINEMMISSDNINFLWASLDQCNTRGKMTWYSLNIKMLLAYLPLIDYCCSTKFLRLDNPELSNPGFVFTHIISTNYSVVSTS